MSDNTEKRRETYRRYYLQNKERIKERSANAYKEKIGGNYRYNSKHAKNEVKSRESSGESGSSSSE